MRSIGIAIGLALTLVGVGGCTTAAQGSIQYPDERTIWCTEAVAARGTMSVGFPLDFAKGDPVTISGVRAVEADGLRVGRPRVMLVADPNFRAGLAKIPLTGGLAASWRKSTVAAGTVVKARQKRDLVIPYSSRDANGGTIGDILLRYEQNGHSYEVSTHTSVRILPRCSEGDE